MANLRVQFAELKHVFLTVFAHLQVMSWRRSYDVPPPAMDESHPYYDTIVNDSRYDEEPPKSEFPMTESLKMTLERTLPYWERRIVPEIRKGKRVMVVAHGNSLRGIVKKLSGYSDREIVDVSLPTAKPFMYKLGDDMMPTVDGYMKYIETTKS